MLWRPPESTRTDPLVPHTTLSGLMSDAMKGMIDQGVPAADLAMLAELVARGRFASAERRYDDAIGFYRQALEIERQIPYQEPAYWYYPVRQALGAALFQIGRAHV